MSSYREKLSTIAPWRRYVTYALTVLALVFVVLVIAGPLRNGVGIVIGIVIAGVSLLVGPRSPFFR